MANPAKDAAPSSSSINVDETGFRVDGENFWLWNFVNRKVALFRIEEERAGEAAKSKQRCLTHLLGDQAPQLSRR